MSRAERVLLSFLTDYSAQGYNGTLSRIADVLGIELDAAEYDAAVLSLAARGLLHDGTLRRDNHIGGPINLINKLAARRLLSDSASPTRRVRPSALAERRAA